MTATAYRHTGQPPAVPVFQTPWRPHPSRPWAGFIRTHTDIGPRAAVSVQDTWPPRVVVTVTDLTYGDDVVIYREVDGERTAVRSGSVTANDPSVVVIDAELPFGVPITYIAVVEGSAIRVDTTTVDLPGGKVALSDPIAGDAAEVVITAWPDKSKARRSTVFAVGGRNVVVAGERGGFASTLDVYTETETTRLSLDTLLENATSGIVQLRQPGGYYGVDAYLAVLSDTEKRWSQDGSDERRVWTLEVVEVDAWPAELEAAAYTLEDLDALFSGQSLAEIAAAYATLLEISQAVLAT